MAGIRDLFQEEFDEKDRQIAELQEQYKATIEQKDATIEQQGAALEQQRKEILELKARLGAAMA